MDVFTGQTTADVTDCYKNNIMFVVYVPANMIKYYQPLDLIVNGYAKRHFKKKFSEWYSQQVSSQLARGINLENIEVKLKLLLIKSIHAAWIVDFYNHMTTVKGVEIITSGWRAAGILDAIESGSSSLPSIDLFDNIDTLMSTQLEERCNNVGVIDEYIDIDNNAVNKVDENDDEYEYYDANRKGAFEFIESFTDEWFLSSFMVLKFY